MHGHRLRFPLGRVMLAIVAVALLFAALRVAVGHHPHVRRCWELAMGEVQFSQASRHAAARYRTCIQAVPCSASEYCGNACLDHVARLYPVSDQDRARAAEAHRRAAEDHQRAADSHAAMARLYRRAAFQLSEPLPAWSAVGQGGPDIIRKYRCDVF